VSHRPLTTMPTQKWWYDTLTEWAFNRLPDPQFVELLKVFYDTLPKEIWEHLKQNQDFGHLVEYVATHKHLA